MFTTLLLVSYTLSDFESAGNIHLLFVSQFQENSSLEELRFYYLNNNFIENNNVV